MKFHRLVLPFLNSFYGNSGTRFPKIVGIVYTKALQTSIPASRARHFLDLSLQWTATWVEARRSDKPKGTLLRAAFARWKSGIGSFGNSGSNRRLEFEKRRQLFIRVHNEALSVVAMRPRQRLFARWNQSLKHSPTPTDFAGIVSNDFPIFHARRILLFCPNYSALDVKLLTRSASSRQLNLPRRTHADKFTSINLKRFFHIPFAKALFTILLGISVVGRAYAGEGVVYATFLSDKDRHNSSGERLTLVADILRQDRANYHNGRGDRKDEDDGGIFATKEGRAKFGDYAIVLENLKASDLIEGRYGSIVVRVVGQKIYVEGVE
jgi:hypothetical protein